MKQITQTYIAKRAGVSIAFVNSLVQTKKRPSWKRAKQIAQITGTRPELWLDGTPEEIKAALSKKVTPHPSQSQSKKIERD